MQYVHAEDSPLTAEDKASVSVVFVASRGDPALAEEADQHGDIVQLDVPEGYEHLWRRALTFLQCLVQDRGQGGDGGGSGALAALPRCPHFVMHADDDSFVRLDLLLPLMSAWPRTRFYWGYIWDGVNGRATAPIRNRRNKSHMPEDQYPLDYYPPFASGCGFVLSWDLVVALTAQPLPDYRLLDPPFGIHLCGPASDGRLVVDAPVTPVHDVRVRPYRALPIFHASTLVQHYLAPEEMRPFYAAARSTRTAGGGGGGGKSAGHSMPGVAGTCAERWEAGSEAQQDDAEAAQASVEVWPGIPAGSASTQGTSSDDNARRQAQPPSADEAEGAPEQLYATLVQLGLLRR